MEEQLSLNDLDVILESLSYSKQRIADYQHHPSYEFKQQQLERINRTILKVRELRKKITRP